MHNNTIYVNFDGLLAEYKDSSGNTTMQTPDNSTCNLLRELSKENIIKAITKVNKLLTAKWIKENELDDIVEEIIFSTTQQCNLCFCNRETSDDE